LAGYFIVMPGSFAASPHRAEGSRTPRLAGVAVGVVIAGGILGVYLSTAHAQHQVGPDRHRNPVLSGKVVADQTVGVIDFGPDDNGDAARNDPGDHPLMLVGQGTSVDFAAIPDSELSSGTPDWTADQMSGGTEIFIYVPTGKCLSPLGTQRLQLTHCDLGLAQRWQQLNQEMVLGQAIAQYANAQTGACLTAPPREPGPARLAPCGKARTRTQEIAFWWSA
jgi:hypothetical protein